MTDTHDVRATFSVSGLSDELHVLQFEAAEAVSELYELHLVVASTASQIAFSSVVGQAGLLTITRDAKKRYLHGIVGGFQQQDQGRNFTVYQITLVPKVWRLLHRADCRIFQDLTTEKIVEKVLKAAGIDASTYEIKLENNTPTATWEYCVQYRESDWAFISRLLEEMGFFYFFAHSDSGHKLIIANNYQFHPAISGELKVPFHGPSAQLPGAEHISRFFFRENVRSGKVTLNDFNPLKPSLSLESVNEAGQDTSLEVYDYPGEFGVPKAGKARATTKLQSIQATRRQGFGDSDCIRLTAGYYFELTNHFRDDLTDKRYMLTRVTHLGEKQQDLEAGAVSSRIQYSNSFQCIPRSTPYRPQEITPKPTATGVQTAVVVGKQGEEEIYTDQYGRVKVQFHWDRVGKNDDNSSCWIRVSQIWASQGWGAMWIPRVGDEVVVDFIEGDPDRPIIAGRLYHAQNMPPYVLPDKKTVSTIKSNSSLGGGGFNEIRFEDKKGKEELFTHAQRNATHVVKRNMSTRVGAAQSLSVGGSQTNTITKDVKTTIKEGDLTYKITEGKREVTIKGDDSLTLETGNRTVVITAGTHTLKAQGEIKQESSTSISSTAPAIKINGATSVEVTSPSIKLTAGASSITMGPAMIELKSPLIKLN